MMSAAVTQDVSDTAIDALVDQTPTVVKFDPDDEVALQLINDVAVQIQSYDTIATRFGLSKVQLYAWIKQPEVLRRIKARRAQWQADGNVAERNRTLYGHITMDAAPVLDRILHDPQATASAKLEAFKIAGRFAGLEAQPKGQAESGPGNSFAVNIMFSGGRVERITPILEGTPE